MLLFKVNRRAHFLALSRVRFCGQDGAFYGWGGALSRYQSIFWSSVGEELLEVKAQDLGSVLLKNQNKYPLFSSSTFNFLPVPLNFSIMKIRHPTQRSRIFKNQYLTQLFDQYFYFFRGNTFLNQTKTFSYHGQFLRLISTFYFLLEYFSRSTPHPLTKSLKIKYQN